MSISSFGIPSSPDRSEAMPAQACYLSASHEAAWVAVYQSVDAYTRGQVAAVVGDSLPQLVDTFYSVLLADNEAGPRLSHDIVATRLHSGMTHWLKGLLCVRGQGDIGALMATQKKVGEVHARVHIPMHLVMVGARILKNEIA